LTTRDGSFIVILDLAIEDIRAREHRGTTGSLGSMKVVSEAPAPGAKLITRRAAVLWARALQERIKVADRVDLRLSFRTIDLQAGSPEVSRSTAGAHPDALQPGPRSCQFPFAWFFHCGLVGMGFSASTAVAVDQEATGNALQIALALAKSVGSTRVGVVVGRIRL
jgi:hypothetical protein